MNKIKKFWLSAAMVLAMVCGVSSWADDATKAYFEKFQKIVDAGQIAKLDANSQNRRNALLKNDEKMQKAAEHLKTVDFEFPTVHDVAMAFRCTDQDALKKIVEAGFTSWNNPEIINNAFAANYMPNILFLIGKKVDLNSADKKGWSPLAILTSNGWLDVSSSAKAQIAYIEFLFSKGMSAKVKGNTLNPVYFVRSVASLNYLLKHGATIPEDILFWLVYRPDSEKLIPLITALIDEHHVNPLLKQNGKFAYEDAKNQNAQFVLYLKQVTQKIIEDKAAVVKKEAAERRKKWLESKKDDPLVQHALQFLAIFPADFAPRYRAYCAAVCGDQDELWRLYDSKLIKYDGNRFWDDAGVVNELAKTPSTPVLEKLFNSKYMYYHCANIPNTDKYGAYYPRNYPLFFMAKYSSADVFKKILSQCCQGWLSKDDISNLLKAAVRSGDVRKVQSVLSNTYFRFDPVGGVEIKLETRHIYEAIESGNLDMVKYVHKETNADLKDTILIGALSGNIDIFNYLVQNGALLQKDDKKIIPYAIQGKNIDLVKYLVENGWALDKEKSLLQGVAHKSDEGMAIVKYLFAKGVSVTDAPAEKLIEECVKNGSVNTLKFFVSNGLKNSDKVDCEKMICSAAESGSFDLVKYLFSNGFFSDDKIAGSDALRHGVVGGNLRVVKFLLFKGFKAKKDLDLYKTVVTSLHSDIFDFFVKQSVFPVKADAYSEFDQFNILTAAANNPINFVKLTRLGFDINLKGLSKASILHAAANWGEEVRMNGHDNTSGRLRFLVDIGFSIKAQDKEGRAPEHYFLRNRFSGSYYDYCFLQHSSKREVKKTDWIAGCFHHLITPDKD